MSNEAQYLHQSITPGRSAAEFYHETVRFLSISAAEWKHASQLSGIRTAEDTEVIEAKIRDRYRKESKQQIDIDYPDMPDGLLFPD